jgi:hypothetical protein
MINFGFFETRRAACPLGMCFPDRNPATIGGHIRAMRIRFSILLSAALLVAAILLVFRDDLHARIGGEVKQCGFWGDMEAGMSCR